MEAHKNHMQITPEIHAKILDLNRRGFTCRQIGKMLNIGHGSVGRYIHVPLPGESPVQYQGPGIRSDKKRGEFSWREWSKELTRLKALKRKSSHTQDHAFIELGDGTRPVALASFSDQHMGSWGCDYERLVEMTDELKNTKDLYIGLLGDYGQYAIKLRSVLEVMDNALPPEQQTEFIESWFSEIWSKVAFALFDNHGVQRSEELAGESALKKMLSKKIIYFNGIGHVDLKVGNQIYRGAVSHAFRGRSMLNPVHAIQRYMRMEGWDREWGMMGDSHVPGMLKYTDGDKIRVAVNSGSLQSNSGYAKRWFSLTTHACYPIIEFRHDKHEMNPYWSVKSWLEARGQ